MRLILVRHGHTDDLKNDIVQGHRPIPLNRRGKFQARLVAKALTKLKIHRIYSSDLVRAKQTTEYIVAHQPKLLVTYLPLLREKSGGVFEGKSHAQTKKILKKHYHSHWHRPSKGESWHDVFLRAIQSVQYLRRKHPRSTVLIVSHGGFLRLLLTYVFHGRKVSWHPEYHHHNTGVTMVTWRKGKPTMVTLNDTRHLKRRKRTH